MNPMNGMMTNCVGNQVNTEGLRRFMSPRKLSGYQILFFITSRFNFLYVELGDDKDVGKRQF